MGLAVSSNPKWNNLPPENTCLNPHIKDLDEILSHIRSFGGSTDFPDFEKDTYAPDPSPNFADHPGEQPDASLSSTKQSIGATPFTSVKSISPSNSNKIGGKKGKIHPSKPGRELAELR
jgi:hypothetical protein